MKRPHLGGLASIGRKSRPGYRQRKHLRCAQLESLEPRQLLAGEVLINEIMYHAASQDQRDEYIELYNTTAAPINLAGWRLDSGAEYVFGEVSIGAGGYLVVAADLARFQSTHPEVTNVVGSYVGRLSNSGETIALVNVGGVLVDEVSYAEEGDWGVRTRGPLDHGHEGWIWTAQHDGLGKSLELVNAALSNDYGQNWTASDVDGGTPGAVNSEISANIAPLVLDVSHAPAIPRSTDAVTVQARVIDELPGGTMVSLFHRIDGTADFTQSPMFDDGAHGDGLAADGTYAAILPPHAEGTIVEFYVQATDSTALTRSYPAAVQPTGTHETNLLYQVDDSVYSGSQPVYRLIMTESERAELEDIGTDPGDGIGEQDSDAQMNGTFIAVDGSGTEVRHNAGIRNRGKGSRNDKPNNYRINLPNDRRWHDVAALALDGRFSGLEVVGSQIFRQAGVPAQDAIPVQARVNNQDLAAGALVGYRMFGSYAALETLDSDFTENHYPTDASGNLYRGFDELIYRGTNPDAYRAELHNGVGYEKSTNSEQDDWQDIISLTAAFDPVQTPDALFAPRIAEVIDVDQWLKAIALHELLGNREQSLPIGEGDDYSLYRGTIDTRFKLIAHDLDTILGIGDTPGGQTLPIFRATAIDALDRLLKHPQFAPTYFKYLKELSDTVLAPENINPLLDNWLTGYFTADRIADAKNFIVARRNHIFNPANPLVPLAATATSTLSLTNGYPTTTAATATLSGKSDAIRTRQVLVNGVPATWSAWEAKWTAPSVALRPAINRVLVQSLDENGVEFDRTYIDIYRNTGVMTNVAGALPAGETHWTVAGGPYHVTSTIVVPAGATLRIDPGATVFFDVGAGLTVNGRLLAEGTELARIHLTRTPGATGNWRGIQFAGTMEANRLTYADQVFGDAGFGSSGRNISANNSRVDIDHVTWTGTTVRILDFVDSSFRVSNSVLPDVGSIEPVHGEGVPAGGYAIFEGNHFGRNSGYNDIMDFSDVHQPDAVLQILNNVFEGGEDDILDLDGCDAYIEGNVFKNTHLTDPANPDTSSAVSGGEFDGETARWTITRNYFYNLDQAVLIKEGAFATIVNNTMVNITVAAINFDEPGRSGIEPGAGALLDGNIIWNVPVVFESVNSDGTTTQITVNHSILPGATVYPGIGNSNLDPHLLKTSGVSDPAKELRLQPGFGPARASGPNGRDMGADVPAGAAISGVPASPTYETSATLSIGGPEIIAYRYRVNGGAWSGELSPSTPIVLNGLADGVQTVQAIAKNSAGVWQAESAATTVTWTVDTALAPRLRISEVLAQNTSAVDHEDTFPDIIELVNEGSGSIDLLGMSLTDDPAVPQKFVFNTNTVLAAGQRLVLYADDPNGTSGIHVGFGLRVSGEGVFLYDKLANGGEQLDGVAFGQQLDDISLSRRADGSWGLGVPTFGATNVALAMGNAANLRINEWLTDAAAPFEHDFIEVYNSDSLPVDLGGLYLTDNPNGWPTRHQIAPLTFVAGARSFVFTADGDSEDGLDHVNFKLSPVQGMIGLLDASQQPIDVVLYGTQHTNVSQGRTPDGGPKWGFFAPSPGVDNPVTNIPTETINWIPLDATDWKYNYTQAFTDQSWTAFDFVEAPASWPSGQAALWTDTDDFPDGVTKHTQIPTNRTTFYFRKHFTVTNPSEVINLLLRTALDDGAVVYLNGHEVLRVAMPTSAIIYSTRSNRPSSPSWDTQFEGPFSIDHQWLQEGDNVLAVEVHQRSNSNDMGFAVSLDMQRLQQTAAPPRLRITELNYNPYAPTAAELAIDPTWTRDDFEFVEILNFGSSPINLNGIQLSQAVTFTFGDVNLPAGARGVIVKNAAAFTFRYGAAANILGTYTGTLNDTSEPISLLDPIGQTVHQFIYSDSGAWPNRPDGIGSSLVIIDPLGNPTLASNWRASANYGGSPGTTDAAVASVVINEVLTHTNDPLRDAIELHNPGAATVNVGGWFLSNSSDNLAKFRVPDGTSIPPGGYLVFDEADFNPTPGVGNSFSLDSGLGDDVWLMRADAATGKLLNFIDQVDFPAAANGESFGRWPNGAGKLYPMASRTLGSANSGPRIGPVVISEIMYHPSGNNDNLEFIELLNITDSPIELYEEGRGAWRFDKGIDFSFAPGTVIPARGTLVVTRFDPSEPSNATALSTFRSVYNLSAAVPLVGGYAGSSNDGRLDNAGEEIRLVRPDAPQPGGSVPYVLVDEVNYDDDAPWPIGADGIGPSLTRKSTFLYGQEPANWTAAAATPATATVTQPLTTINGTSGNDTYHVVRSGTRLLIYENIPPMGPATYESELAALGPSLTINTLGGDDTVIVNSGGQATLGLARLIYNSGAGANSLVLETGSARIDSTVDSAGALNSTIQQGAQLSTIGLAQAGLTLAAESRVTVLPAGGTSRITSLNLAAGATLDITDNALVVDYTGTSPVAEIRAKILSGRGGSSLGKVWNGPGITSSTAAQAPLDSRAVGYAENSLLPLGAYGDYRGQPVDATSILIAYTRTADANLDGVVNNDDVAVVGANYLPGAFKPAWAVGDFEFNGSVDNDDVALLGAFYNPSPAPLPAPPPVQVLIAASTDNPMLIRDESGRVEPAYFALQATSFLGAAEQLPTPQPDDADRSFDESLPSELALASEQKTTQNVEGIGCRTISGGPNALVAVDATGGDSILLDLIAQSAAAANDHIADISLARSARRKAMDALWSEW